MKNNAPEYEILIPVKPEDIASYYKLRFEVLRKPWNQDENSTRDEWEDKSLHLLMKNKSGKPIATGRLQFNSATEGQIRSMAVAEEYRHCGLGTVMLKQLEKEATLKNLEKIVLDSRNNAVRFYESNGYKITGDSYILFGVIPHFSMMKVLK